MKCDACGGDGLIEYGAYRGDESDATRVCTLCGGVPTIEPTRAAIPENAYPQGSGKVSCYFGSASSVMARSDVGKPRNGKPKDAGHIHLWERIEVEADDYWRQAIKIACDCGKVLIFNTSSQLVSGQVADSELEELSRRAGMAWLEHKQKCRERDREPNSER